jgi:hypothetical protein
MYTLIEYPVGIIVEAVVLSMEKNRLRVAAPGFSDALEFTSSGNRWITDEGQEADVLFLEYGAVEASAVSPSAGLALAVGAAAPGVIEG